MRVHGHLQGHVVLECGLQCAEQDGEAGGGGFEHPPDLGVCVCGEPGLGDAQVGRVVLVRDELELDGGGMGGS
jgi:hypothetical protein